MGNLSANFSASEFKCPHCGRVGRIDPNLVQVLQRARNAMGRPLVIVSGWRCEVQNRRVGGIRGSQHLHGRAADIPGDYAPAARWLEWGAVGVGVRGGRVIHVDMTPRRRPFVFDD